MPIKAALMLNSCGADWEPRWVDFFNGETRTEDYKRDVNVMGEVPVLVHGDEKLSQSGVILNYLADVFGKYGARSKQEEREILRWILFDNHKLTSYTGTYRFLRHFMKTGDTPVTEFLGGRMHGALPSSTNTWAIASTWPLTGRPSPTFRSAAIFSSMTRSASTGTSIPTSMCGCSGSRRCPAGSIPMT